MVCSIDSISFIVKNWTTLFDRTQEGLDKGPIWVQPLGLKVELWLDQFSMKLETSWVNTWRSTSLLKTPWR